METVVWHATADITHIIHSDSVRGPVCHSDVGTNWAAGKRESGQDTKKKSGI